MSAKNKFLEVSFVVLTVVVAWNLQLNSIGMKVAEFFGFARDSFAETVAVGIFAPMLIALIAAVAQSIYGRWVWKFTSQSGYFAGTWVYALIAQVDGAEIPVAGWFILKHDMTDARIDEAKAYYLDEDGLTFRGEWTSDAVWVKDRELGIVFHMRALGIEREPIPSEYHGFLQVRLDPAIGRARSPVWTGHFHDLGERTGIHGPVAAKRLKRTPRGGGRSEEVITEHIDDLRSAVLQRMGREKMRYANKTADSGTEQ